MANEDTVTKTAADEAAAEYTRSGRHYRPNVDIVEHADELVVLADLPGARAEAIEVKFEDGALSLHAAVEPRGDDERGYLLQEYGVGDFFRTFQVSETIDAAKITADYADGVLTLRLPKTEATRPRKIGVKAE